MLRWKRVEGVTQSLLDGYDAGPFWFTRLFVRHIGLRCRSFTRLFWIFVSWHFLRLTHACCTLHNDCRMATRSTYSYILDVNRFFQGFCFWFNMKLQKIESRARAMQSTATNRVYEIIYFNCVAVNYLCACQHEWETLWTTILYSFPQVD